MRDAQKDDDNDDSRSRENIFQIMDGIIGQLNKTKKMFIIMILTIMIIPPIAFAITFALLGPPFLLHDQGPPDRFVSDGFNAGFGIVRMVPFIISTIWLAIGIWQWSSLSKWTEKYERYKQLQKKIDEKLSDDKKKDDEDIE